jgi:phosphoribosylaminoimidazole-succinocarboxamide synthase
VPLAEAFVRSGKVRDLYRLDNQRLLLVASDRLSAFDVVLPTPIPDKGRVLTGLSRFWFRETAHIVPNHLLSVDPADVPASLTSGDPAAIDELRGRLMIGRAAEVLPIECVVRGFLSGSGWKEYRATGSVCGIPLPDGLRESDRLPAPIFTPAWKAPQGQHDENITFERVVELVGERHADELRRLSIELYELGVAVSAKAGIILADTKFEFGVRAGGELILLHEGITPPPTR